MKQSAETTPMHNQSIDSEAPILEKHQVEYEENGYDISRQVMTIGNSPPFIFITSFEDPKDALSHCPEGTQAVLATAPEALAAIAERTQNSDIQQLQQDMQDRNFTPACLDYLDSVAAALCIETEGSIKHDMNPDALCDVISALYGDEAKRNEIADKVRHLRKYRRDYKNQYIYRQREDRKKWLAEYEHLKDCPELTPEDVVLVHVTKHKPEVDEDGNVVLYPTAYYDMEQQNDDGTTTIMPPVARGTIHFMVNSKVKPHAFNGANWEGTDKYVIIVNLAEMLRHGTAPVAANPVDTYFESSPGSPLILQGATVVSPEKGGQSGQEESEDQYEKRVQEAMILQGAQDIFMPDGGGHYLSGYLTGNKFKNADQFSVAYSLLCDKYGIPSTGLHMGTPDERTDLAYYDDDQPEWRLPPEVYAKACDANQQWAVYNGRLPTRSRRKIENDLIFM